MLHLKSLTQIPIATKDQSAEFLKTTPEALDAFEASYYKEVLSQLEDSDNLFDQNAKEMSQAVRTKNINENAVDQAYLEYKLTFTFK